MSAEFAALGMAVVDVMQAAALDSEEGMVVRSTAFACACRWVCTEVCHVHGEREGTMKG